MLSVIICTYNRDKYIYECLSCLAKNTKQEGWEIVLVNNNSTDNTATECERFVRDYEPKNYRYFVEIQQGLSYARNRGIKEAKGEWFIFLDDDAMVEQDYIAKLADMLAKHPNIGAFGGQIEPFFEGETPNWLSPWAMGFVSAINLGEKEKPFPDNSYPIGANMGISRTTIVKIGDFNTSLGRTGDKLLGGEEKDIFVRMRRANIPIYYFPNIKVHHCIPTKRTTEEFIAQLGYGVGQSERLRTIQQGAFAYGKRLFSELIKWGGTLAIWLYNAIQGHRAKGDILVLFRCHVTKGLIIRP